MRNIYIVLICVGLFNCSKPTANQTDTQSESEVSDSDEPSFEDYYKLESYQVAGNVNPAEVQSVDFDCAIIVHPTEEQMEEIKAEQGEESFYSIADDYTFYQSLALEKVDSAGIRREAATMRYIRLSGGDKEWTLDMRKKGMPAWNLIFFKKGKTPEVISAIDLTSDHVRDYFEVEN